MFGDIWPRPKVEYVEILSGFADGPGRVTWPTGGAGSVPALWLSGVVLRNCVELLRLSRLLKCYSLTGAGWICVELFQLDWRPISVGGERQHRTVSTFCYLKAVRINKASLYIVKKYTEALWILTQTLILSNFLNWNTVKKACFCFSRTAFCFFLFNLYCLLYTCTNQTNRRLRAAATFPH